jgi:hypothetical protein
MAVTDVIAYLDATSEEAKREKVQQFRESPWWAEKPEELARIEANILDLTKYEIQVRLAGVLDDGREISGGSFSFGAQRRGIAAIWLRYRGPQLHDDPVEHERLLVEGYRVGVDDFSDAVNQMLGRDPDQHRPPRLSWDGLIAALSEAGVTVTEDELIQVPLRLELSNSAVAVTKG